MRTPLLALVAVALFGARAVPADASPCCALGFDRLTFQTGAAAGTCGELASLRCSHSANTSCGDDSGCDLGPCVPGLDRCLGDLGLACSDDTDCVGTCSEVIGGGLPKSLACGSLSVGGGLGALPQPVGLPSDAELVTVVTGCDDASGELTLGPATAGDTGSAGTCSQGRRCSNTGGPCAVDADCDSGCDPGTCETRCTFGPPVPIANPANPPFSYCLVTTVAEDVAGSAQCADGNAELSVALASTLYLTGDLLPDPGIQPCPLCTGPGGAETCRGGPNDGGPCTPGSDVGDAYPTSQDCPPHPSAAFGPPLGERLTLGTGSRTLVAADLPQADRVFCGFCRDLLIEGTGAFEDPPRPCTTDADCTPPYESCAQKSPGALGAAAASRIVATGSTAGQSLADGNTHDVTLVDLFCVPPTQSGVLDNVVDLPGPGAFLSRGTLRLSAGGAPQCGNGVKEAGELCDGADDAICPGRCQGDCTCAPSPCCTGGWDHLTFESGLAGGACGQLRSFRCSPGDTTCSSDADCDLGPCWIGPNLCAGDLGIPCTVDADCAGVCEEVTTGGFPADLLCGGSYLGGGYATFPQPAVYSDMGETVTEVTGCDPLSGALSVGPATAADTGSSGNCSEGFRCSTDDAPCVADADCPGGTCEVRCLFGAPVPISNLGNPPFSMCAVSVVSRDVAGTVQCDDGATTELTLGLSLAIHLTGDLLPDPGVQPCPLCTGTPGAETCRGGPNDGLPCVPGGTDVGDAYPTSQDCPPFPSTQVGEPRTPDLSLTTGTLALQAVDSPGATRAFCGFCRDVFSANTNAFENPAHPCTSDADCAPPFESCAQRSPGAFGNAAATFVSVSGSSDGQSLADGQPHDVDLAHLSCLPPSFGATDVFTDTPGPAATLLHGTWRLSVGAP